MRPTVNIFWFRRDLRLSDNAGLHYALKDKKPVVPIFIFDRNILDDLDSKTDRRIQFIYQALEKIQSSLLKSGSTLDVRYGFPEEIFKALLFEYNVEKVFTNHDYEPYARKRDDAITSLLNSAGVSFQSFKDQVIFEKNEIIKLDNKPYTVFTPYAAKWKATLNDFYLSSYPVKKYLSNFYRQSSREIPSPASMGFIDTKEIFPTKDWDIDMVRNYKGQRDFPALKGTSRLSVHLRFGTISTRKLAREAGPLSESFLNELIWRDFYQMILWQFPRVEHEAFKKEYDTIPWRNNEKEFEAWCKGETGYPIVDAGMRELNETGYMHNRVRMITASFLVKHLLIDWRWGEAYFAAKLLDYDLAANNGGWQWAAGSGCDAVPYFRIFNPTLQTQKFDPGLKYIRKWVPEFEQLNYQQPIVSHEMARQRCLEVYKKALKK